ncbi:HD domain-containing protein [Pedobacter frigiditerrae]|uniref:HD domain-containing protein n=1 Tax=Pedobacter frigiditerrae TaxID=2530452 RepID=A0A4R0MQR7_9SPHI|nr:HD domain-containing protein [Pedobacter frigiditerrae]TCC89205.1 HD domain-containing protein [Pedobacter frigiditerrae]
MNRIGLIEVVSQFVGRLLKDELDSKLYFHSQNHTLNVVNAVIEIAERTNLSAEELLIVEVAAWFHDVGYTTQYKGHEKISIKIAKQFLKELKMDRAFVNKVVSCISATTYPQSPKNKIEMVICDADFYHLSREDYNEFENALRLEWEKLLNVVYQDKEWNLMNLEMLTSHEYFTIYGKEKLQPLKDKNIQKLLRKMQG